MIREAHPALFQPDMVRAILDDRKTMTRRLRFAKINIEKHGHKPLRESPWAHYKVGDLLWVREGWQTEARRDAIKPQDLPDDAPIYFADEPEVGCSGKRRPSIHLPRKFSRLTLEIVSHKVERLQDISEADAIAEGALAWAGPAAAPRAAFCALWCSINGDGSWKENPEVVAVGFKVHRCNVDKFEG